VRHVHGDLVAFTEHVGELHQGVPEVVLDMMAVRREDARRAAAFAGIARRAVVVSSADVYRAYGRVWRTEAGDPDPVPLDEDAALRQELSHAGLDYDKIGVEAELASAGLPVTILRLPAVHGPGDRQHRLYRYVRRMDDDRPAILLDEETARWRWTRGYVENVATAIVLAVTDERATGRVYNVQDEAVHSEAEWVRAIARVHGWGGEVLAVAATLLPEAMRWSERFDLRQDIVLDSTRIRAELGYREVVDCGEGIRRTIEWERANPPAELDPDEWDYKAEDRVLAALGR
jgi:nucleoside-diphosphate-sugar epimerase